MLLEESYRTRGANVCNYFQEETGFPKPLRVKDSSRAVNLPGVVWNVWNEKIIFQIPPPATAELIHSRDQMLNPELSIILSIYNKLEE